MSEGVTTKTIHFARFISQHGGVSPWCATKPRALDLRRSNWTNRREAVTCKACLKRHAQGRLGDEGTSDASAARDGARIAAQAISKTVADQMNAGGRKP